MERSRHLRALGLGLIALSEAVQGCADAPADHAASAGSDTGGSPGGAPAAQAGAGGTAGTAGASTPSAGTGSSVAGTSGTVGLGGATPGVGGAASGTGGEGGTSSARGGAGSPGASGGGGIVAMGGHSGTDAGSGGIGALGGGGAGGTQALGGAGGKGGAVAACATNQIAQCTGTSPIECHFGGDPGDYLVTVDLGGAAAGDTYIEAESFRRVLGDTVTAAGTTARFSFFVNVRQPEGQPIQSVPAGTPGLDLYLYGSAPKLSAICFEAKTSVPKLWIAGDSTVCDQDTIDYAGWGQHLAQFFLPPISVANYADSGESSGSFLGSSKLWGAIKAGWAQVMTF